MQLTLYLTELRSKKLSLIRIEKKHAESINDQIIIQLVNLLDGQMVAPKEEKPPFSYFGEELRLNGKRYRLIWLLEDDHIYIGVVNAYRR